LDTARDAVEALLRDPARATRPYRLPSGEGGVIRPLLATDGHRLGAYFAGLSSDTRRRFGPHPFDQATADRLCATLDVAETLRVVAVRPDLVGGEIVAYFIVMFSVTVHERARYAERGIALDAAADCTLAPSVADGYQSVGLGGQVLAYVLDLARQLTRRHVVLLGGTQATNVRAIHFYEKHGFRTIGSFEEPAGTDNFDMVLTLS